MAKIKQIKMTRDQRNALIERIKREAREMNDTAVKAVKAGYEPSEEYVKLLKVVNTYYTSAKKLQDFRNKHFGRDCYSSFYPNNGQDLLNSLQNFEQENLLEAAEIKFDFSNLESDLILQGIEGLSIEEFIKKSLKKYKK